MKLALQGKRAFVSTGGAGMGYATCPALHELGAKVHTCDIDGKALAMELGPNNPRRCYNLSTMMGN